MVKRFIWVAIVTVFFVFQLHISNAAALEMDENTRSVTLNDAGETAVLSAEEVTAGQRLFNSTCTKCHLQGKTKTNNNISLGLGDLAKAEPPRDNVVALVEYLKNPKSYDGETDISEEHPTVSRPDLYPDMRNLTDDDLFNVASYL
ncbi:MAG: photosystem II cytochrome c-550, partial [Microcystaceae cyanobacterium]